MKITRNLCLSMATENADGTQIRVHSVPIDADIFEEHFIIISKVFAEVYISYGPLIGPRTSALMLRKIASEGGIWEGKGGVKNTLFAEIRRLTNVAIAGAKGWEVLPYQDAITRDVLDPATVAEVDSALVYFTVASCIHQRRNLGRMLDEAFRLWGAQTTSSDCTEWEQSLPILTPDADIGTRVPELSVPS